MTVGDGIFWSTIILVAFASIFLVSKYSKWKTFFKVLVVIAVIGAVAGAGVWLYYEYLERPQKMTSLNGIDLGMSEVDVILLKGKPTEVTESKILDGEYKKTYSYVNNSSYVFVYLESPDDSSYTVFRICTTGYASIFGLNIYSSEERVIEKLGQYTSVSINKDGTNKIINYDRWNVAFGIEKGNLDLVCVTTHGIKYGEEYGNSVGEL